MRRWMWHQLVAVIGFAGLVTGVRADTWPLFRHDSRNTGASTDRLNLPLHVAWQRRLFRPSELPVIGFSYIVADGERVYVSAQRRGCLEAGPLWALDLRTGEEAWQARGCLETGALAEDTIYSIFAIPQQEYRRPPAGPVSPWVVWLTALDARGGQVRWQRYVAWWPRAGPAATRADQYWSDSRDPQTVTCLGGSVYVGTELAAKVGHFGVEETSAVGLVAFEGRTGEVQGEFLAPSTQGRSAFLLGPPVVTEGAVYFAPYWGHDAYALAPGTLRWHGTAVPLERAITPMLIDSLLVSAIESKGGAVALPDQVLPHDGGSYARGKVHLVTHIRGRAVIVLLDASDYVVPVDIRTLEWLWKRQILVSGWGIGTENAIVVPGAHRDPYRRGVYALDLDTGRELWQFTSGEPGRMRVAHMAFSRGRLLVATTDGWLYCLAGR